MTPVIILDTSSAARKCPRRRLRLRAGHKALEAGNAAGAREIFEILGDYGNAKEMIAECDWQIAVETADSGNDAETLAKASALLRAIPGKPEAIDKANETDLLRARMLLEQGDWQGAQEAPRLLPALRPAQMKKRPGSLTELRAFAERRRENLVFPSSFGSVIETI